MQATIPFYLNSDGNVVAISGSIGYNSASLTNPRITLGSASMAAGMMLTANSNVNGAVGFLIDSDRKIDVGQQEVIRVTFDILGGDSDRSDGLAVTALQGSPTRLSASDEYGNNLPTGGHGGYINTLNGYVANGEINVGGSPMRLPPQPEVDQTDTPPKGATPTNTITPPVKQPPVKQPPVFLGGHETADTPITGVTPTGISNTIGDLTAKLKSNPLLMYGGIAAVLYLAFKKK